MEGCPRIYWECIQNCRKVAKWQTLRFMASISVVNNILETRILDRLRAAVAALPEKTAVFNIEANYATAPGPCFRITPMNPQSAPIRGSVASTFGIYFTIGEATCGEVYLASWRSKSNKEEEDHFFGICRAVFTTHFSEDLTYNRAGSGVLRSRITLQVGERRVRISGHQIFWWLYPMRKTKHISYEPYY